MMKNSYIIIWIGLILVESFAQVTSKIAADALAPDNGDWFAPLGVSWFWLSVAADIIGFLIWMTILRTHELSFAFLASSFCYVLVILSGWLFFHEHPDLLQITGSVFIVAGITFLSKMDAAEEG